MVHCLQMRDNNDDELRNKRRLSDANGSRAPSKVARLDIENPEKSAQRATGWQAAMSSSLAEVLQHLKVDRHLTAREVKKLLRAVLTNDDVVSAFRRYINLSEPETGVVSAATRKRAKNLGLLHHTAALVDCSHNLEPRVITRSLARTIEQSLPDYFPHRPNDFKQKPCTILDMEFPDDEEQVTDEGTDHFPAGVSQSIDIDEDYVPGPADLCILRRDQALDLPTFQSATDMSSSPHEPVSNLSPSGDQSNQSSATDMDSSVLTETSSTIHPSLMADDCAPNQYDMDFGSRTSPYRTRFGSRRGEHGSSRSSTLLTYGEKDESMSTAMTTSPVRIKPDEPATQRPEERDSIVESDEEQIDETVVEDGVYADFLRSLFPSDSSSENTPHKKSHNSTGTGDPGDTPISVGISSARDTHNEAQSSGQSGSVSREFEEDDDPDDPEFDVMAELDQVNREDFLDELRDDRAVRVSKMEAKSLHQDLQKLFCDDDDGEEGIDTSIGKPHVSTIFAMKSHCHRLLTAKRKLEEPEHPSNTNQREGTADLSVSSTNVQRNDSPNHPKFPQDELTRLKRQLAMHIQLLTTSFVCTYDFPYLHQTVTRPCASALKQLTSLRDAFDLLVGEHRTGLCEAPSLRSFYWSVSILDDAVHLISDYAGLSVLPQLSLSNRPLFMSLDETNSYRAQSTRVVTSLPLPHCLIRLMTHNPIWSYPALMPATLPSNAEPVDELGKSRKRIGIDPAEDALLLMGLADFHGARLSPDEGHLAGLESIDETQTNEPVGQPSQYIAYRFIRKHLLPFRTMLQLRSRRWNLVGSKRGCAGLPIELTPPTDRLAQLFRSLSRRKTLQCGMLLQLTQNLAEQAIPYRIAYRFGCLADLSCAELFTEPGLPKDVGYETVLFNQPAAPRVRKGEFAKCIHDIITDFAQQAKCLWWSCSAPGTPQRLSLFVTSPSIVIPVCPSTSSSISGQPTQPIILKTEEPDRSANRSDSSVLGPNFLPAIPVDLAADGRIVLSKNMEPALVEVDPSICELRAPPPPSSSLSVSTQSRRVRGSNQSGSTPSVKAHVESLLQQIRTQLSSSSSSTPRRLKNVLLHPQTLRQLASSPAVHGKLPLPPLTSYRSREDLSTSGNVPCLSTASGLQSGVSTELNNAKATLRAEVTCNSQTNLHSMAEIASYPPNPPPSPTEVLKLATKHGAAVTQCQQIVDALIDTFHSGLDKVLTLHGETLFGSRRFDPLPKHSFAHVIDPSKLIPQPGSIGLPNQIDQSKCGPWTPAVTFFSNTSVLTANRFLARCKARGEATSADLLTLNSSITTQRQSVLDEMDVRRARSFLDRSRVYLDAQTYGRLVLLLRNLNQIVYQPSLQSLDLPPLSPAKRRQAILNGLGNVLDVLRVNRSLWEDFVCLLTPLQARTMGLLPTYLNLLRVGRAQRVMLDLVPRGKRFWRRLRNLADSNNPKEKNIPIDQTVKNVQITPMTDQDDLVLFTSRVTSTSQSTDDTVRQPTAVKLSRIRSKAARVRSPITKTWAFLESTWRNRPILLSQQACLLNVNHKPYSGFEQTFEEIDTLARNPLKMIDSGDSNQSVLDEGWEVSTELSSAAARRRRLNSGGSASLPALPHSRQCPCPCHPSASVTAAAIQTGKPVKADSLGLRHCISCSLRVHRGIVYVDECNFHLRHVEITWPPDFQPKARLLRTNGSTCDRTEHHRTTVNITTTSNTTPATSNNLSTRALIAKMAESHKKFSTAEVQSLDVPLDFARRRVSIEFIPPSVHTYTTSDIMPESLTTTTTLPSDDACNVLRADKKEDGLIEDDDVSMGSAPPDPSSPLDEVTSPGGESNHGRYHSISSPSTWMMDDDEAACFNTEAFAAKSTAHSQSNQSIEPHTTIPIPLNTNNVPWDVEEDRQLLEFSKARGRYSSAMFRDLADSWIPKPTADAPHRTATELKERFKQLIRLMLGDAYDSDLFCSPEHENSEDETN